MGPNPMTGALIRRGTFRHRDIDVQRKYMYRRRLRLE